MIYTPREKLTIIQLNEYRGYITFEELEQVLWERPANVIYVENAGVLEGIISMGDIDRAVVDDKEYVKVNTSFTHVFPNEYMRAKEIFRNKRTINAVPVKSNNKQLLGEYARWDDLYRMGHLFLFSNGEYVKRFFEENNHVVLVHPAVVFENKGKFFEQMKELLIQHGVTVDVIDRSQLAEFADKAEVILFTDEDELRGTICLYKRLIKEEINVGKCMTYCMFADSIVSTMANVTLSKVQGMGVKIFSYDYEENSEAWIARTESEIRNRYLVIGEKIIEKDDETRWSREFFGELYDEDYAERLLSFLLPAYPEQGMLHLKDYKSRWVNIEQGERVTVGQPQTYENCIHLYGPCCVYGLHVEDRHTIASFLQARVNQKNMPYKVINHGIPEGLIQRIGRIMGTSFREGDIVIIDKCYLNLRDIENINIVDALSRNGACSEWFALDIRHCNYKVTEMIAAELFSKILLMEQNIDEKKKWLTDIETDYVLEHYIKCYFGKRNIVVEGKTGAIVMNCNPFTYGHRYLIEEASKRVDSLIIFVVEENQSVFSFNERYAMVCEGVSDLAKIVVVPSGAYILSNSTFPDYFKKQTSEETIKNIEGDVRLFAERIAPPLNISVRFIGEEPEDEVTNEYNKAMKKILPDYGVEVIEIPRKMEGGNVISASSVRRCLENKEWEYLDRLLPESTRQILKYSNS